MKTLTIVWLDGSKESFDCESWSIIGDGNLIRLDSQRSKVKFIPLYNVKIFDVIT